MPRDHRGKPCARTSSRPSAFNPLTMGDRQDLCVRCGHRAGGQGTAPPGKLTRCRIFAENHADDPDLAAALERALAEEASSRSSRSESSPIFLMTT
jgi:hypothetical protein